MRTDDLSGNRPRNTPDFAFNLRANYNTDLSNGGNVRASVGYAYAGKQYYTEFNDPRMMADGYGVLDANLKVHLPEPQPQREYLGQELD